MIRILHTSDLHIGKRLYQADLNEDLSLYFAWLAAYIREQQIEVLLVSGDVFDVANPSSESRRIYFELLRELMLCRCKVIIAGGNHDSPAVLEAPGELLRHLDIHVVGGLPEDISQLLVPVKGRQGHVEVVVACIPFLRDADIRRYSHDETYEDRVEAVRKGIISVYEQAADRCRSLYPNVPAVAMGHLFVQGSEVSESERDIQVGNLAGLDTRYLPDYFACYALGHLHKPQAAGDRFFYSGSPVKLSFSEAANRNRMMLISVDEGVVKNESIAVPLNRRLVRLEGTVDELDSRLKSFEASHGPLPDLIELLATEENQDPSKLVQLESVIESFRNDQASILKYSIKWKNKPLGTASLYHETQSIAEMNPADVFRQRLDKEGLDEPVRAMLMDAFSQLLEEVYQNMEE